MKQFKKILAMVCVLAANFVCVEATPSSVFWTFCTTEVVPTGVGKFDADNYFTLLNKRHHGEFFNPDFGIEFGIFTWDNISAEAGFDYLGGDDHPFFFNAKVGVLEDRFFCNSPSMSVGIFDIGTNDSGRERTNFNIVDIVLGKTLPSYGRFYIGAFSGSKAMGKNRAGFMVAYDREFCPAVDCYGVEYYKWAFSADYASGKNTIGGGGFALIHNFTPAIMVETGPTWFNSAKINGRWKWSVQFHIQFPVVGLGCCKT